jgi:hypothetical protein
MKYVFCQFMPNVLRYRMFENGLIYLGQIEAEADFKNIVQSFENDNYFEQFDGSVWNCNCDEIYTPDCPGLFDFGDYQYLAVSFEQLTAKQHEFLITRDLI